MKTLELSKYNVIELNSSELEATDGGWIIMVHSWAIKAGAAVADWIGDAYRGAYEAGHDDGENNCDCHN